MGLPGNTGKDSGACPGRKRQYLGGVEAQDEEGRRKVLGLEVKASMRLSEWPPS